MSFFVRDGGRKSNLNLKRRKRALDKEEEIASESELSADEAEGPAPDASDDEEEESAQAKRFRLAKQMLAAVERQEEEQADDGDHDGGHDAVAQRLKEDSMEKLGRLHRKVADSLSTPIPSDFVQKIRGHQFSPTCVALSSDGKLIVTASKDGSIVKSDLETGARSKCVRYEKDKSENNAHKGHVMAVAISPDDKLLVTGGADSLVKVWDLQALTFMRDFKGHKKPVTGLAFRRGTRQLFSSSRDHSVKAWDMDQMGYVDTMFGHQDAVTSVDCLSRERAVSCGGQDRSVRMWKVADESQLVFNGLQNCRSIDCVRMINEDHFISGGMDGSLNVWSIFKKKPVCVRKLAHGTDGIEPNWIVSVAANRYTDLVASGSKDGWVRLWKVAADYKSLEVCSEIALPGFINDMAFSTDGTKLVCAVGQEHKNGRWWKIKEAKNCIAIIPLTYTSQ